MKKELKVKSVRYYETRRGLGYECKTNFKGVSIWNDGHGGETYLNFDLRDESFNPKDYEELSEGSLEELINDYEYQFNPKSKCCNDEFEQIENEHGELKDVCSVCGRYCEIKIHKIK